MDEMVGMVLQVLKDPQAGWGKSTCPSVQGTQLVYNGSAAGSYFGHTGSGSNYLCMPHDPEYTHQTRSGDQFHGVIYGAEYENPIQGTDDHGVPCAVCLASSRETVLMIPAKTSCPTSWTAEYSGYLMSERNTYKRTMYECVDQAMESLAGSSGSTDGALFYHVEVECGTGLPCPPYIEQNELSCVVCTL